MLATAVFTANAQDTKPYEEKMSQIEAQFKKLEADYQASERKTLQPSPRLRRQRLARLSPKQIRLVAHRRMLS